ncbi:MAG: terpene cyclase/mutase family protein [Planctomycetota bacterium]|nr:terpene cyclase/mutase family protein [Planctomycetota bacterium]
MRLVRSLLPRLLLLVLAAGALCLLSTAEARDEGAERGTPEPEHRRAERHAAIRRGCDFLCGAPGSVPATPTYSGKQRPDGAFGDDRAVVALTAMAALALMADGSTDGRGRHGMAVQRAIDFLLKLIETPKPGGRYPEGYFWHPHDTTSRMHGQGFATLTLATALGTSRGKRATRIRTALIKAIECIEGAQTRHGGFGYQPVPAHDHEGSVTVAVAQGLRAARDAGITISNTTVSKGLGYLKSSQKKDGSFQYSLSQEQSSYALTAAALSSFFLYGTYGDDDKLTVSRGIQYLRDRLSGSPEVSWYYYGHFYAAWACWQWDGNTWDNDGKNLWAWWQSRVYPHLLDRQVGSGAFETYPGRYNYGPVLSTSFAILTLAIPDETIPIFQR